MNSVRLEQSAMPAEYRNLLAQNPILAQMAAQMRTAGWKDSEIKVGLLIACVKAIEDLRATIAENERVMVLQDEHIFTTKGKT